MPSCLSVFARGKDKAWPNAVTPSAGGVSESQPLHSASATTAHSLPADSPASSDLRLGLQTLAQHTACCTFEPLPAYSAALSAGGAHKALRLDEKDGRGNHHGPKDPALLAPFIHTAEAEIKRIDAELRQLSLRMWDIHEIAWQEHKTHDLFVAYLGKQPGWKVTPHAYGLDTAFEARFEHRGKDHVRGAAPVIGFNSELDALPGIGHACGHNLIACAGVAAALSTAKALVEHDVSATISLLGTPAEEGGGGKVVLLDRDAYKGQDACFMVHPAPFDGVGTMLAVQPVEIHYKGKTSHSGAAPWEGINALDAAVLAYTNISALRQQIRPDQRVHGILSGSDLAPNVIPSDTSLVFNIRSPDLPSLKVLSKRVHNCFEAAALATGCEMETKWGIAYADLRQSGPLADDYASFMESKFGRRVRAGAWFASTDFGNVSQALPGLHPFFAIPLPDPRRDGNHTIGFAKAARTEEAHRLSLQAALGLAAVASRVVLSDDFRREVRHEFEEWKRRGSSGKGGEDASA